MLLSAKELLCERSPVAAGKANPERVSRSGPCGGASTGRLASGREIYRRSFLSVALNLHGFYAGLERTFELIATAVDGQMPAGEHWHQLLLEQMASEIGGVRPAVISDATRQALDEYRGFRHVIRTVYTFRFDPDKMQRLVENAPGVLAQAQAELLAFASFVERQADSN